MSTPIEPPKRAMREWRTLTLIETGDTNGHRYYDEPCLFSVFQDPAGIFWYVEHTALDEKHGDPPERGHPVTPGHKPAWVGVDGSPVAWRTPAPEEPTPAQHGEGCDSPICPGCP